MNRKKRPAKRSRKSVSGGHDTAELARLAQELQNEVQVLEGTHPRVVELANSLCLMLSRLGI